MYRPVLFLTAGTIKLNITYNTAGIYKKSAKRDQISPKFEISQKNRSCLLIVNLYMASKPCLGSEALRLLQASCAKVVWAETKEVYGHLYEQI